MADRTFRTLLAPLLAGAVALGAQAQGRAANTDIVYSCTDASGKRYTADRLIAQCMDREQRVLSRDGSLVRVIPPTLTLSERAEVQAREQRAAAEREKFQELQRRDRNLLQRYPDEPSHDKARAAALQVARAAVQASQERLRALAVERKPLATEAEFYVGKPLPPDLRQKIDANDAAVEAQKTLIQNQQAELARVNAGFDAELGRLRKLWSGAVPGTLGPIETAAAAASAAHKR